MERVFFSLGSLLAALAVAAGAYGAHGGSLLTEEQASWIAKAARYQMYHALALVVLAGAMIHWPKHLRFLQVAGWLFLAGIFLFCGSLYLLAFTGIHTGYVTPAGGIAFMLGWLIMAAAVWFKRP
ncbi:MAG: DUF423 domain-containing protein [Proteobacteria bacterium]|nr:DUF423 domain-containing protein [Pseudomonadota bacterium]MBU0965891.1 DUF423 domain-containing protein [Pseudomonadota bacterium]